MNNYTLLEKGSFGSDSVTYQILNDTGDVSYLELERLPIGIETIEELTRYCEDNLGVIVKALMVNGLPEPIDTNMLMHVASLGSPMLFEVDLKFNKNSYGK